MTYNSAILEAARGYLGTEEWPGARHNPVVVGMFEASGHGWVKDDETPWCAAFVNAVLGQLGLEGTGKLNARSFLDWGEDVPMSQVQPGDVVIFSRGDPNGWQGHVGFVAALNGSTVTVLGGNQGNKVSEAAYPTSRLLGFRRANGQRSGDSRPTLRRGSRGRFVLDLQEQLRLLGYNLGKPDGIYGPLTASAVREYQEANGLATDGIVGPRTWAAIEAGGEPAPRRPDVTEDELRKRGSETIKAADEGEAADRQTQREVGWLVGLLTALGASSEWLADGGPVAQVVLFVEDHWWVPVALGGAFLVYKIGRRKRLWGDIRFRRVVDALTGAHRGR